MRPRVEGEEEVKGRILTRIREVKQARVRIKHARSMRQPLFDVTLVNYSGQLTVVSTVLLLLPPPSIPLRVHQARPVFPVCRAAKDEAPRVLAPSLHVHTFQYGVDVNETRKPGDAVFQLILCPVFV